MTVHATAKGPDQTTEIVGEVEITVLVANEAHQIGVGTDTYRCAHCEEDHPLAFVSERTPSGHEDTVVVQNEEEAWAIAEFLLVDAFKAVGPATWGAMRGMAELVDADPQAMN